MTSPYIKPKDFLNYDYYEKDDYTLYDKPKTKDEDVYGNISNILKNIVENGKYAQQVGNLKNPFPIEQPPIKSDQNKIFMKPAPEEDIVKEYPSVSNPEELHITMIKKTTGEASCDCKGFRYKKEGQPRTCKHIKEIASLFNLKEDTTWFDNKFGGDAGTTQPSSIHPNQIPAKTVPKEPELITDTPITPMYGRTVNSSPSVFTGWNVERYYSDNRYIITITKGKVLARKFKLTSTHLTHTIENLNSVMDNELGKLPDGLYDVTLISDTKGYIIDLLEVTGKNIINDEFIKRRVQLEEIVWISELDEDVLSLIPSVQASKKIVDELLSEKDSKVRLIRQNNAYVHGISSSNQTLVLVSNIME